MRVLFKFATVLLFNLTLASAALAGGAAYELGFYAGMDGKGDTIALSEGQDVFEMHLALSGEEAGYFSGVAFGVDLPEGIILAGPIRWRVVPGLTNAGRVNKEGVVAEFHSRCLEWDGGSPLHLATIPLRLSLELEEELILMPRPHSEHGLKIELCEEGWPKPDAAARGLRIRRGNSLWQKLRAAVN